MKLLVLVKQILNRSENKTESSNELNPNDLDAVELALRIKDILNDCEITVMSMGVTKAKETIRNYLALGIDKGVLITDKDFAGSDTLATSRTIAEAIKLNGGYDLIICGVHSSDGGTGQVGPELAESLGCSLLTNLEELIDVDNEGLQCKRKVDGYFITEKLKLPAVITVMEGTNEIRAKTIRGALMARKKDIQIITNGELMIPKERCGLSGSATKVKKIEKEEISTERNIIYLDMDNIDQIYKKIIG